MNRTAVVIAKEIVKKNDERCSNSCDYMRLYPRVRNIPGTCRKKQEHFMVCRLFDEELKWDKRCKSHGYRRCNKCKKAEELFNELERLDIA